MFPSIDDTSALLATLSESYAVEVKRWLDPNSADGRVKLVKAMIALRNNNGGRLVVGFDDATMLPALTEDKSAEAARFQQDDIQSLVTKYASEAFEVLVQYPEFRGSTYPVICVAAGVKTPVATKGEIKDPASQKVLLPINTVFVRTLKANNTVSTAAASWQDLPRLCELCFDNREADIGRFVRRHLNETVVERLGPILGSPVQTPAPDHREIATAALNAGRAAFDARVQRDGIDIPQLGYFEIGAVVLGELREDFQPNRSTLNLIRSANRRFTGWPFFAVLDGADLDRRRPKMVDDSWEQAVIEVSGSGIWGQHSVDFWRIEPTGKLYAIRAFDEDFDASNDGKRLLTITVPIWRVADALVEALAIAKSMVLDPSTATLAVALRWTHLQNRKLTGGRTSRMWTVNATTDDDTAFSSFSVPLDLPDSAIAETVSRALAPLYRKFDGWEMPSRVVDEEIATLLSRTY